MARGVEAAAGPAGRFVLTWLRPRGELGPPRVRAATAGPGARRFDAPYNIYPEAAGLPKNLTLAGTPRGFIATWPASSGPGGMVWRAALAADDGRLADAGALGTAFPRFYSAGAESVRAFGDRTGRVTAVWAQPPEAAPTPPTPPQPGAPPPPPPPPEQYTYTLTAADATLGTS